jgi:hypothetical protein
MDELRLMEERSEDKKRSGALSKKAEALTEQAGILYLCLGNRGLSKKDSFDFN